MSRGNVEARRAARQQNERGAALSQGALCLSFGLALAACAHGAGKGAVAAPAESELARELSALRAQVSQRDQLVTQLEGRLSLLEAEQRQLRYAVAERDVAPVGLRETVRIGEGAREEVRAAREPKREVRPVLRLYEDKRGPSHDQPLQPVPTVSERLPIAPLPTSLGMSIQPERDGYVTAHRSAAAARLCGRAGSARQLPRGSARG